MLVRQDGAQEPQDRPSVGEDANDIGPPAELSVLPLEHVRRVDPSPALIAYEA